MRKLIRGLERLILFFIEEICVMRDDGSDWDLGSLYLGLFLGGTFILVVSMSFVNWFVGYVGLE